MGSTGVTFVRTMPMGRRIITGLTLTLLLAVGAIFYFSRVIPKRESAHRVVIAAQLQDVAAAMIAYQRETGALPSIEMLAARGDISPLLAVDFVAAQYRSEPRPSERRLLFVQRKSCPAVRKGDAWGGPGETSAVDRPAVRYVLWSDGAVEEVEESTFQQTLASDFVPLD